MADLEKRPEAISQVPPAYPAELRKAKIEGLVTLMFVLGEDGRVEDPRATTAGTVLPSATRSWLHAHRAGITRCYVFGQSDSVSTGVYAGIIRALQ